jgi:hypothetical protein
MGLLATTARSWQGEDGAPTPPWSPSRAAPRGAGGAGALDRDAAHTVAAVLLGPTPPPDAPSEGESGGSR